MSTKRPNRRDFLKAAAGAVGAGVLVACGAPADSSQTESSTAASTAAASDAPAAAAPEGGVAAEGVLWGLKYDPHVAAYGRLAELFKKQTGSTLRVEPQDWPLETKMIAALAAGTQPDVACIMGKVLLPLYLQKALMPLSDVVYKENGVDPKSAFTGDAIGAYTYNNDIWGVPVEVNGVGQVVNVPVEDVKALGLADRFAPTNGKVFFESYDEMFELAKALQTEENGTVTRWGLSSKGWDTQSLLGIIRSQGVKWWDNDAKKFNIDSEAGVEAMRLLVEEPVKRGIETELDQSQVDAALAGKVAIARGNGTPAVQGGPLGFVFEIAGAPRVKPGEDPLFVGEGGWGFAAPAKAKNQDLAVQFLRMMATEEGQLEYAKIYDGLGSTAWTSLADDTSRFSDPSPDNPIVKASKLLPIFTELTEYYGEGFGYVSEIETAGGEICSEVRQGNLSAADGAKQLQERCEAQYQQYLKDTDQA